MWYNNNGRVLGLNRSSSWWTFRRRLNGAHQGDYNWHQPKRLITVLGFRSLVSSSSLLGTVVERRRSSCWDLLRSNYYSFFKGSIVRTYISRAHPKPRPVYSIPIALEKILDEAAERTERRKQHIIRNNRQRNHPIETIELVLILNLDPRKPGQTLRGNVRLPHGSGKKLKCLVFTDDDATAQQALEQGATHAGGETLIESIVDGKISLDDIDRGLGTSDMMSILTKKAARILGPRGLMPNAKTRTLLQTNDELIGGLETQIMGKEIVYRTEKEGGILIPVGKVSFGVDKLLDNIGEVVKEIHSVKPEQYGKGKKTASSKSSKGGPKYVLKAYVASTQGKGYKLDLKTIDPSSAFFLKDPVKARMEVISPSSTTSSTTTKSDPTTANVVVAAAAVIATNNAAKSMGEEPGKKTEGEHNETAVGSSTETSPSNNDSKLDTTTV